MRTELQTPRLLLRPFCADDVDDTLEYRDDPEFARFLPHVPQPFLRSDAIEFVACNMSDPWERLPTFAVVLQDRVIGTVNLEIDPYARSAMLGYAFGRAWWGRGFAIEAARAIVAWAASKYRLRRVWASTDARHQRSRHLLGKLGMRCVTVHKGDHEGRAGVLIDEAVYELVLAPTRDTDV